MNDPLDLPFVPAATMRAALPLGRAVAVIEEALRGDVDPERDSPRLFSPAPGGEFLIMPGAHRRYAGVKVATVAPRNPARGLAKIQAVYLLFDADTLAPLAAMDGTELTALRTPATTLAAVKNIAAAPGSGTPKDPYVLVLGAGVQALNHVRAARAVFPRARFAVVGKRPARVDALVAALAAEGIEVARGDLARDVPAADVIVCVTSSPAPLFDGALPADHAIVAAVGQHGLDAREVDATLVHRADVVVEGRESSWREAGDLVPARSVAEWRTIAPPNLKDLIQGRFTRTPGRPTLYTGVGMAWEDIVVAAAVYEGR
ncbi:ornithine cyclodeaminase family protein [Georgenia sp. TF02-10]|uniref:ornithine cyclodeaminase family protein n=1 Tax=Georgenia sp. TF02-10 TaxID=2917725 RepID=UPI001FA71F46|nr:ornithine cyclodeaminase family protein [Georgenia sp. TF02-10]UNX55095.1 ornithine cyclodeaminase family protein [Georgenia sp. TF02-10]